MARKYITFYNGMWKGSLTDEQCEQLLNIKQYVNEIEPLFNIIKDLTPEQVELITGTIDNHLKKNKSLYGLDVQTLNEKIGDIADGTLEPYQTIGVGYMYTAQALLLGDEVGLGKTVQVAGLVNLIRKQNPNSKYVIFTELTAVREIREKMVRFTGQYAYLLPNAQAKEIDKLYAFDESTNNMSIVATHSALENQRFISYILANGYDCIIFDEGGAVRKPKGLNQTLHSLFKKAKYRYILNATPVETGLRDIYHQLDILDMDYVPTLTDFEKSFVKKQWKGYTAEVIGYKDWDTFTHMSTLRYLARTRRQLNATYQGNTYRLVLVPQSEVQRDLIKRTSLKYQVIDYPTSVYRDVPFNIETTPKLKALLDLIESEVVVSGNKMLIYCKYKDAQYQIKTCIEELGLSCEIINGDTPEKERQGKVKAFAKDVEVLITSVYRSLDLGYCDVAVFYSISGNPQLMRQFEGRITRSFNVMNKTLYLIASKGYEIQYIKGKINERIVASQRFTTEGNSLLFDLITNYDGESADNVVEYDDDLNLIVGDLKPKEKQQETVSADVEQLTLL